MVRVGLNIARCKSSAVCAKRSVIFDEVNMIDFRFTLLMGLGSLPQYSYIEV